MAGFSAGLKTIDAGVIKTSGKELDISIGIDKTRKEKADQYQRVRPLEVTAAREKPQRSIRFGFAFIILLLFVVVGYQMYGSFSERSPRWDPEEFASQKESWLLNKQRESFKAEIEKVEKTAKDQTAELSAALDKQRTQEIETAPLNTEEKNDEESNHENNPQNDPAGAHAPVLAADQKSIIYFKHNSNELPQNAYETLDNIIKSSAQRPDLKITVEGYTDSYRPDLKITVEGYTDSYGDPVYNKQLSKYRAEIVRYYLIAQGVSASKIKALGRGNENPLESNETFEGRKQNRSRFLIELRYYFNLNTRLFFLVPV
jgi:outer membrane protein OmpA-like peptidoglycan-associated protein